METVEQASAAKKAFCSFLETTIARLEKERPSPAELQKGAMPVVVKGINKRLADGPAPQHVQDGVKAIFEKHSIKPGSKATWEDFSAALTEVKEFALSPPTRPAATEAVAAVEPEESQEPAVQEEPAQPSETDTKLATLTPKCLQGGAEPPARIDGHPLRGISVRYLCTTLIAEVERAGLTRQSKVYEIEPIVIRGKGDEVTCPRDSRTGAAYVDCLSEKDAALATHMLSYTWGYAIGDICDSLMSYCEGRKLNPSTTYFWICCLCINQHRVVEATAKKETVPFEKFKDEFGDRVQSIGRVVALMSPWKDPHYTKRVWCDFEMYTAAAMGDGICDISVTMPPREAADMRKTLMSGGATVPELWEALQKVKIEDAQASVAEDKERIFKLIQQGIGFHSLNSIVAKCLQSWVVTACKEELDMQIEKKGSDESLDVKKDIAHLCAGVSYVFRETGQREKAHTVMEEAIKWFREAKIMNSKEGGALMSNYGANQRYMGNLPGAFEAYSKSKEIYVKTGTLKTPEGAMLFNSLGAAKRQGNDLAGAFDAYHEGQIIFEELGMEETTEYAMLFNSIGACHKQMGDSNKALESFEKARGILEKIGAFHTPPGTILMNSIGAMKKQRRDLKGALDAYETSQQIMERMGTIDTENGERTFSQIGGLKRNMKDFTGAVSAFKAALKIREKLETLHTQDGQWLKQQLEEAEYAVANPGAVPRSKGKGGGGGKGKDGKGDWRGGAGGDEGRAGGKDGNKGDWRGGKEGGKDRGKGHWGGKDGKDGKGSGHKGGDGGKGSRDGAKEGGKARGKDGQDGGYRSAKPAWGKGKPAGGTDHEAPAA